MVCSNGSGRFWLNTTYDPLDYLTGRKHRCRVLHLIDDRELLEGNAGRVLRVELLQRHGLIELDQLDLGRLDVQLRSIPELAEAADGALELVAIVPQFARRRIAH